VLGAEAGELPHRLAVGAPCIEIADVRVEELAHPVLGFRTRQEIDGRGGLFAKMRLGVIRLRPVLRLACIGTALLQADAYRGSTPGSGRELPPLRSELGHP